MHGELSICVQDKSEDSILLVPQYAEKFFLEKFIKGKLEELQESITISLQKKPSGKFGLREDYLLQIKEIFESEEKAKYALKIQRRRKIWNEKTKETMKNSRPTEYHVLITTGMKIGNEYHLIKALLNKSDMKTLVVKSNKGKKEIVTTLPAIFPPEALSRMNGDLQEIAKLLRLNIKRLLFIETNPASLVVPKPKKAKKDNP